MRIGELNKNSYAQLIKMINPNVKNAKMTEMKLPEARSKTDIGNFNPNEWANTNGMKGMYIRGGQDWKKIIPVSDDVKRQLEDVVKRDFIATNGKSIPDGSKRNDVIIKYLGTISADKRSPASWTLGKMAGDYTSRLEALVKEINPNWKPGNAFDTSILDQLNGHLADWILRCNSTDLQYSLRIYVYLAYIHINIR